ncbi:MAG: YYY domain-containing protein [Cellvibrionaceae bacterium]|jgi:YYY domain-containing protein
MSLSDLFSAFRFWLVLMALGTAGSLFAYRLFYKLPDKGYAFSKMAALVMTTFTFWLISSYGLVSNSIGGIILAIVIFGCVSLWLYKKTDQQLWPFIKDNLTYILTAELVFALLFFGWAYVRAQNPQIAGTEKPMEFAFLNAVTTSPTYPPLDPWLSGFAISYYYMGYIMMSIVGRLAAVQSSVTFNLTVAWLVAGSGIGAFGLVYNLTILVTQNNIAPAITQTIKRNAVLLAIVASVALPLAGNNQMLLETLHGNNIGSDGLWAWLDVRDIDGPATDTPRFLNSDRSASGSWWWWRSSRVIEEYNLSGSGGLEPIAEFPGFSFVLGDIHPHVLALPYIFLVIALALTWYLDDREWRPVEKRGVAPWIENLLKNLGVEKLIIAAILLGGLAFTNTWDLPIHLFIVLAAFGLNRWGKTGRFDSQTLVEIISIAIALILLIFVIYYPFLTGLNSQAGAPYMLPMLVQPTRLAHFLVIFGTPVFVILGLLGSLILKQCQTAVGQLGPALLAGLGIPLLLIFLTLVLTLGIAASPFGAGFFNGIVNELAFNLPLRSGNTDFGWAVAFVTALLPMYLGARLTYLGVTLLLGAILGGIVWLWTGQMATQGQSAESRQNSTLPFLLLLIFTGALLALGPEYVYLKDNFGQRINTIFKFYYQVWILLGVSALVGIGYLLKHHKFMGWATAGLYAVLFIFAVRFPIAGAQSRAIEYRGPASSTTRRPPTLDGLVFMQNQNVSDYQAVQWLNDNAAAGEVVLEATGGAYSYYGRISANTGLPTLLGWANHENQWRGDSTDQVAIRSGIVREIYDTRDWDRASNYLDQFDVTYIYVGRLEQQDHDPKGLEKFAANLEIAYQNEGATIYQWK